MATLLALTLLKVADMLMNADLLSHDALNVDFVRVVIVLNQSNFYGFFEALRVNRQLFVRNEQIDRVFFRSRFNLCNLW